ncbi:TonB-dependent receptor domain-containing protein [Parvularcula marina]|uniref:TonB-dependent receptor domain-containing protein n=1 Tax=Parvularcula marina TaxID=2292771 RepID=UPI003516B6FE
MNKFGKTAPSALLALAMCGIAGTAVAQEDEGDVIVVRGALVPDEKQNTAEISSLLDAEDFERQGDSDIASALKRVAGLSITDGKFPVARGLNERYSSATLNGVPIPSPEPLRRAAPLDIVPTRILAGSLAQKTYSPEYSAEFGGAAIDLRTVGVPNESFVSLKIGMEVDTETTLREGYFYDGSDTDVLGFDDGLRNLPGIADRAVREGVDAVGQIALDTAFEQDKTLLITEGDVPVNGSFSASVGLIIADTANYRIGTTTHVGYSNEWQFRDAFENRTEGTNLLNNSNSVTSDYDETRQEIGVNAFNTTGIEFGNGDHEIALTTYLLRSSLKSAKITSDTDNDVTQNEIRRESTSWLEREVWQGQFNGTHLFADMKDLEFAWRVAYGEASREEPYNRQTYRILSPTSGNYLYAEGEADENTIKFSELQDENFYFAGDFTLPFDVFGRTSELRFGGSYRDNSRSTLRRDFDFRSPQTGATGVISASPELAASRIDLIYSDVVLASNIINISARAGRLFPDASDASMEVTAAYALADVQLNDYLRASVGVRYEDSSEETSVTLTTANGGTQSFDPLEEEYFLPAVTLTWNPFGNIQVRGAYSQTITRPQFRELAVADFVDPNLGITLTGNPFLVNSEIDNYDVRAEWYFARNEFLTVGLFYKDITNPIEQYQTGREANTTSFLNAPSAEVYGVEVEFEKKFPLDEWFDGEQWYGKELFFATNYTWSESKVSADGIVTIARNSQGMFVPDTGDAAGRITDGRKLQGQSDHLFNLQLGIENIDTGTKLTGLVNYASERVLFAETVGGTGPAVLEQPPVSFDLVFSQDVEFMSADYGLGISVKNILGEDYSAYREDISGADAPFLEYDRGTKFSISLSRDF